MSNRYANLPDEDDESLALHATSPDDELRFMDTTADTATPSFAISADPHTSTYGAPPSYEQTYASATPAPISSNPFESRPTSTYVAPLQPPQTRPLSVVSGSIAVPVQTVSVDQESTHSTLDESVGETLVRSRHRVEALR
jgi:hypothetical protein